MADAQDPDGVFIDAEKQDAVVTGARAVAGILAAALLRRAFSARASASQQVPGDADNADV